MIFSSGTLHHQKSSVRGYLYKKPYETSFFQKSNFYKRYFIISQKQNFVQVQDQPVTKKYKTILKTSIICIQNIKTITETDGKTCPWWYSFELKTHARSFLLFAFTPEERDLWINGFNRLLQIPVIDTNFVPMAIITKSHMQHMQSLDQVTMTEGNNLDQRQLQPGPQSATSNDIKSNLAEALMQKKKQQLKIKQLQAKDGEFNTNQNLDNSNDFQEGNNEDYVDRSNNISMKSKRATNNPRLQHMSTPSNNYSEIQLNYNPSSATGSKRNNSKRNNKNNRAKEMATIQEMAVESSDRHR